MENIHNIDKTVNIKISTVINWSRDRSRPCSRLTSLLLLKKGCETFLRKGVYRTPTAIRRLDTKVRMHVDNANLSQLENAYLSEEEEELVEAKV